MARKTSIRPVQTDCPVCAGDSLRRFCDNDRPLGLPVCALCGDRGYRVYENRWMRCVHPKI
jgi:hypothetical protein